MAWAKLLDVMDLFFFDEWSQPMESLRPKKTVMQYSTLHNCDTTTDSSVDQLLSSESSNSDDDPESIRGIQHFVICFSKMLSQTSENFDWILEI